MTDWRTRIDWDSIAALFEEQSGLFHKLVRAARLEPSRDFRDRCLLGFDLGGADLRGFNFSGSDLRGTNLQNAAFFDETTIIDDRTLLDPEAKAAHDHNKGRVSEREAMSYGSGAIGTEAYDRRE